MGEVGTNTADSPNISIKMNGVNGRACENEPMDADSQDDSQESSELSVKQSETNEDLINKKLSLVNAPDGNSNLGDEDDDEEIDEEDEEVDSLKKPTLETITENSQEQPSEDFSNHSSSEQNGSTKENGNKEEGHEEDVEVAAAVINKTDAEREPDDYEDEDDDVTQGSEVISENEGIPPVAAANVDVAEHDEEDDESTQDSTANQKNPLETVELEQEDLPSKSNDPVNNGDSSMDDNDVQHIPIVQEVHAISDSDDDEEQITKTKLHDVPEPMEVDGKTTKENGLDLSMKASVSIISDSENEEEQQTRKNGNNSEIQEISDKEEDCVVIEDDKRSDKDSISPRRSTRARKSVVKVRDFSAFDDDIEEVVEDPLSQPAAKKLKTSPPMGLTIQDARSLATDPLLAAATFQQQFIQSQGNANSAAGSGKKEPTLVIIDTNQIMQRGGTAAAVQALQSQNLSVHPVGVPAQGIYPTNMRASITPVMQKSPQSSLLPTLSNKPAPPLALASSPAAAPLLPALTDDMFVLEAPSFIVPYIYEKPPTDNLKDIVEKVGKDLIEQRKQEAEADAEAEKAEAKDSEGNANADEQKDASANNEKNEKKKKSKKHAKSGDESWDESDTSTDEEASDTEQRTKVLIKDIDEDLDSIKTHIITPDAVTTNAVKDPLAAGALNAAGIKRDNYFDSPLGKFFMDIGINLVQENVQTDLLRQQKKKLSREGENAPASVQMAINSLKKNLEHSKSKNDIFKHEVKRCEYCNFKSESSLAMAHHYETPHISNNMYKCNFCSFEARPPYDILFHMEAVHNIKARLEKSISYHQCPNCPFEDNGRSKLGRHALVCAKKFRPETNLVPPVDWEPPAKIPRIKPRHGLVGTATAYQAMAAQAQRAASAAALQRQNAVNAAMMRGRGRPQTVTKTSPGGTILRNNQSPLSRPQVSGMMMPNNFQMGASGQFMQQQAPGPKSSKTQQPSISITPLPRQPSGMQSSATLHSAAAATTKPPGMAPLKPGQTPTGGKSSIVICEICDGYIMDLDQLRNHMQWMHKVKIHPKMIYNRPPLNCQKCQFRFFTDQGLERHLLGSHGLVTSSMQEAANKGKDAGRCPVCGRMYQWKLLNHVSRDHNMTLKPAHLSYKCTVCTATFGMYKQFENHVYSAHSTVAKKAMDGKKNTSAAAGGSGKSGGGDSLLKPLKINDEITIIPQPAQRQTKPSMDNHVIEII